MSGGQRAESGAAASDDLLTVVDLAAWCRRARLVTSAKRQHLDEINLIFDDDLDTGSNLEEMWTSIVDLTELAESREGLRTPAHLLLEWGEDDDFNIIGRSTRILRRYFRAMADATRGHVRLDTVVVAEMFAAGANIQNWEELLPPAGKQPRGPQPGTILDVVDAAADAAQRKRTSGLSSQLQAIADAARTATASTPSHHSVLRRTGVVDAGALGLSIALAELSNVLDARLR
jgi:dihydroxyacetone kinase-like predicted kinase